mgnify:CR=1 FL=1
MNDLEAQRKKDDELTLIREFAKYALAGATAADNDFECEAQRRDDWEGYCQNTAESSFDYADAMLAEYKKRYGVE